MVLGLIAVGSFAEEQTPAVQEQASSIPALTFKYSKDTLTISWPKSATDWMLSTQSIDAKGWSFVPAAQYGTNAAAMYLKTALPAKTMFFRLVKIPSGIRNKIGLQTQLPALPPMPKPGPRRVRPTGAPPNP